MQLKKLKTFLLLAGLLLGSTTLFAQQTIYVSTTGDNAQTGAEGAPVQTITTAMDKAQDGDIIQIATGTYVENLAVSKKLTFVGEKDVIVMPSEGNVVDLNESNVIFKDIVLKKADKEGYIINLASVDNLTLDSVSLIGGRVGLGTGSTISVDTVNITNSLFERNTFGISLSSVGITDANKGDVKNNRNNNWNITNTQFVSCGQNGFYAETVQNITFENVLFFDCANDLKEDLYGNGCDINLYPSNINEKNEIIFNKVMFENCGLAKSKAMRALAFKIRTDKGSPKARLDSMRITNCIFTGNKKNVLLENLTNTNAYIKYNTIGKGILSTYWPSDVDLSYNYWVNVDDCGGFLYPYYADKEMTQLVFDGAPAYIKNAQGVGLTAHKKFSEALAVVKAGETIQLGKIVEILGNDPIIIDKSITIQGVDSANTVLGRNMTSPNNLLQIMGDVDVKIKNLRVTYVGGNALNNATAISAGNKSTNSGFAGSLLVENCKVEKFGKTGIGAFGGRLTVKDCFVDVTTNVVKSAKNGIQVDYNTVGTVTGSTVYNAKSQSEWSASGILTCRGGQLNTVTGNTLINCQVGIAQEVLYDVPGFDDTVLAAHAETANEFLKCDINVRRTALGEVIDEDVVIVSTEDGYYKNDVFYYYPEGQSVRTLAEAIAKVDSGKTIQVKAGEYLVTTPIELIKSLNIIGEKGAVIKGVATVNNGCFVIPDTLGETPCVITLKHLSFEDFGGGQGGATAVISQEVLAKETALNVTDCRFSNFGKGAIVTRAGVLNVDQSYFDVGTADPTRAKNGIQFEQSCIAAITRSTFKDAQSESIWNATGILGLRGGRGLVKENLFENCQTAISEDNYYNYYYDNGTTYEVQDVPTATTFIEEKNNTFNDCNNNLFRNSINLPEKAVFLVTEKDLNDDAFAGFYYNDIYYYYKPYGKPQSDRVVNTFSAAVDSAHQVAAIDMIFVDSGIHTESTVVTLNKSLTIMGAKADSLYTVIQNQMNVTLTGTVEARASLNFENITIESAPAKTTGMIDIKGSFLTLNTKNVKMINQGKSTSASAATDRIYTISAMVADVDSVIINVAHSEIELTGPNQHAITTENGKNHEVNITNSYIHSPNASSGYAYVYGVRLASKNSILNVDQSIIDVNYYAVSPRRENLQVNIKNSKLTGWAALYLDSSGEFNPDNIMIRIDNCQLTGRSYWNGASNGFAVVILRDAKNANIVIHNTKIQQEPGMPSQYVIDSSELKSGKVALTGTTSLRQDINGGEIIWNPTYGKTVINTAESTVKFYNAQGKPAVEARRSIDRNSEIVRISSTIQPALYFAAPGEYVFGNNYPKTPVEIAQELTDATQSGAYDEGTTILNNDLVMSTALDSARDQFKLGKNSWYLKQSMNGYNAEFEAKLIQLPSIAWSLPGTIYYNTPVEALATTTSGKPIVYSVLPADAAKIEASKITFFANCTLSATIETQDEYMTNTVSTPIVVSPASVTLAELALSGIEDKDYTGSNVANTFNLILTRKGEPLKGTDYSILYTLKGAGEVAPIDVGTYVAHVVLKGNYVYADKTQTMIKEFKILAKKTTDDDLNIAFPSSIVYGTKMGDVAITCDRTKGMVAWSNPEAVLEAGVKSASYIFTATNKNYSNFNSNATVNVDKRTVQVVVQDSSITQGTADFIDSSYVLVNYIKNEVDTIKNVVLVTDYSVDSVQGEVARIFVKTADSVQVNQKFVFADGKLLIGEPAIDTYTYTIASETYGSGLSQYAITTTSGKGFVRYKAGQEALMPTVEGIKADIEYVLYGKVAEIKTVTVKATAKVATIYVDTKLVTVKDPVPALTASAEGVLAGETLNYILLTTYSSFDNNPGTYMINVLEENNPNYNIMVVGANVVSSQINLKNALVNPVVSTYNGAPQTARYTIVYENKTLVEGTDYTVANATTTEATQLTSTISFMARYTGTTTAVFNLKPATLTASLFTTESPYNGEIQKPQCLFKTPAGVVVNFVKNTEYSIVDSDLKEIRHADSYIVKVIPLTSNFIFQNQADTTIFTVLKLNASFMVRNAVQTWAEELYPTATYQATVNSNNPLLSKDGFEVSYGGDQFDELKANVKDSGLHQIWVKVTDSNFEWNVKNTSLGFLTLNVVPVPEIFFDKELSATRKEVQNDSEAPKAFVDVRARIVGTMLSGIVTARLNLSGSAVEGVNYEFENDKKAFVFTPSHKTDTIRVVILDDGAVTPDLDALFSLIEQTDHTIVRAKQANYLLTIETIQQYAPVDVVGFANEKEELARPETNSYLYAITGKEGMSVFVKVSGAKANDVNLRDQEGDVIVAESSGYPIDISAGNVGLFTMEIVNNDLIKPGASKVITLTLAKAIANSGSIAKIEPTKRQTKLIIKNTSPIGFSDEFGYEIAEAKTMPAGDYAFSLDVLRNDQAFLTEDIMNTTLFVSGVRNVGEAKFSSEIVDAFGNKISIDVGGSLLYRFDKIDVEGFTTTFEYELSQVDAGVSIGVVTLTLAPSTVRGQATMVLAPQITKKPAMYATYLDPNSTKASVKNKMKKLTLQSKLIGSMMAKSAYTGGSIASGSGVEVLLKSNVKAYNSKLLSQTQKAGIFTSSMYNQDSELIYTPVAVPTKVKTAKNTVENTSKVLQSRKLGLSVTMKNLDAELAALNITPALNVRMADTVITANGDVLFAPIFSMNKTTNAFTIQGDFFGPSVKFFLEYHDGKQIKKVTLSCKRSITFIDPNTGMKVTLKRGEIVSGKDQQEWVMMPSSVEKLILSGKAKGARFDLVIDNGSMLTILPNLDVETIINFNRK